MKFTNIVLSALLVIALCLVTTAFFRQSRIANSSAPVQSELATAPVAAQASERGPVRMVRFVLMDGGLYPREMRVNQGFINLAVEDETGGSEGLVVDQVVESERERITTVRRITNARRGRELLRFTPGRYIVYDASKPDNKANMFVEQ